MNANLRADWFNPFHSGPDRTHFLTSRFSHLEARPLKEATEWMDKQFWNESFDRLDAALAEYLEKQGPETQDEEQKENDQ